MRQLFLLATFLIAPLVSAQELHTFSNGEVADAEKINENFQYVLENATGGGGCSAEQDRSSVVISCADGTSGVLASEGTVIRYPNNGDVDEAAPVVYNTGDIVIMDAADVVLGKVFSQYHQGNQYQSYVIELEVNSFVIRPILYGQPSTETVRLIPEGGGGASTAYWLTTDCSGPAWIAPRRGDTSQLLVSLDQETYFVPDSGATVEQILFSSRHVGELMHYSSQIGWVKAGECESGEFVADSWRAVSFSPSEQIKSAAYPVRLEQLP